jgi:hypothetical protein
VTQVPNPPFAPVISTVLSIEVLLYSPEDHATRNSGYNVSPPQAKIVCPVM